MIHTITAKTRWPATGRSAESGSSSTTTIARMPASRPTGRGKRERVSGVAAGTFMAVLRLWMCHEYAKLSHPDY